MQGLALVYAVVLCSVSVANTCSCIDFVIELISLVFSDLGL